MSAESLVNMSANVAWRAAIDWPEVMAEAMAALPGSRVVALGKSSFLLRVNGDSPEVHLEPAGGRLARQLWRRAMPSDPR